MAMTRGVAPRGFLAAGLALVLAAAPSAPAALASAVAPNPVITVPNPIIIQFPVPTVESVTPDGGPVAGGTRVTIVGSGLSGATEVDFGPHHPATGVTVVNGSTITAISPPGTMDQQVDVTVTTPGGTSATVLGDRFQYAGPTITAIAPATGPTTGGTQVTITGSGFTGVTGVDFGAGHPATGVTVLDDGTVIAVAPPGSGTVYVTVSDAYGVGPANGQANQFTYVPPSPVCQPNADGVLPRGCPLPPKPQPPHPLQGACGGFDDVAASDPSCAAVRLLTALHVVSGYGDGTFRPDNSVTRAEFAKLLVLALGLPPAPAAAVAFPDVAGHWAARQGYLQTAVAVGALNGYPDGTFRPDASISRAEAVKVAVAALGAVPAGPPPDACAAVAGDASHTAAQTFADVSAGAWYAPWIGQALAWGLLAPDQPTPLAARAAGGRCLASGRTYALQPGAPLTRGEAALLLGAVWSRLAHGALNLGWSSANVTCGRPAALVKGPTGGGVAIGVTLAAGDACLGSDLLGVAYGGGTFVAVGRGGVVLTSPDGTNWTAQASGTGDDLKAVTYGDGRFVAVGGDCQTVITSGDGVHWSAPAGWAPNCGADMNAITFGGGQFLAVGSSGDVFTSPDGIGWPWAITSVNDVSQNLMAAAYGGGTWVGAGAQGAFVGDAGNGWVADVLSSGAPTSALVTGVAYGQQQFLAVDSAGEVLVGDGFAWAVQGELGASLTAVAYAHGQWVAVGAGGAVFSSGDGADWIPEAVPTTQSLAAVAHGAGTWVAVGADGTILSRPG
jgi:hypothetical protein